MSHQVTISDIARQLNISTSTVSRALKGHPDVNPKTKERILALAQQLEYEPNQVALSLLNRKTFKIGVIVPKLGYYFFSTALNGIEDVALPAGYSVIACQSNESYEREVINTKELSSSRVDGFIVSVTGQSTNYEHFKVLQRKGIPLIFFDRVAEELNTSKVIIDNKAGSKKAVKHLIDNGCKRIAYIAGPKNLSIDKQRLNGYIEALQEAGMDVKDEYIVHRDFNQQLATEATHQLLNLPEPPDGISTISDRMAIGAMVAVKEKGLSIPDDIAIIGFNNEPMTTLFTPQLSTVDQPVFEMGRRAAQLFLDEVKAFESDKFHEPETVVLNAELLVRGSSDRKKSIAKI